MKKEIKKKIKEKLIKMMDESEEAEVEETSEQKEIKMLHKLLDDMSALGFNRVSQIEARLAQLQK